MKEFLEFLGEQSPYDRLDDDDLSRLARAVEVEYFTAGTVIVEADAAVWQRDRRHRRPCPPLSRHRPRIRAGSVT